MARRAQGEGNIRHRPDGRWEARPTMADGSRPSIYGKTPKEVVAKRNAVLHDQERGLRLVTGKETVAQYLDRWLSDIAAHTAKPKTMDSYRLNVRRLQPHIGRVRLNQLNPARIQAAYGALLAAGLSRRSVEQAHTVLHGALRHALRMGLIATNPTDAVTVPRPQHREMTALSQQQVDQLIDSTEGSRWQPLWILMVTTGLRLGEATGLQWCDVDLDHRRLSVDHSLGRSRDGGLQLTEPKSKQSRRTITLPQLAVQALRQRHATQLTERLQASNFWQLSDFVFTTPVGKPLEPSQVNKVFHRALEQAGLPRVRVHDLRHTAASLALKQGKHPKEVQDLLGHSTIAITLDLYSHLMEGMHDGVADAMDRMFSGHLANR